MTSVVDVHLETRASAPPLPATPSSCTIIWGVYCFLLTSVFPAWLWSYLSFPELSRSKSTFHSFPEKKPRFILERDASCPPDVQSYSGWGGNTVEVIPHASSSWLVFCPSAVFFLPRSSYLLHELITNHRGFSFLFFVLKKNNFVNTMANTVHWILQLLKTVLFFLNKFRNSICEVETFIFFLFIFLCDQSCAFWPKSAVVCGCKNTRTLPPRFSSGGLNSKPVVSSQPTSSLTGIYRRLLVEAKRLPWTYICTAVQRGPSADDKTTRSRQLRNAEEQTAERSLVGIYLENPAVWAQPFSIYSCVLPAWDVVGDLLIRHVHRKAASRCDLVLHIGSGCCCRAFSTLANETVAKLQLKVKYTQCNINSLAFFFSHIYILLTKCLHFVCCFLKGSRIRKELTIKKNQVNIIKTKN